MNDTASTSASTARVRTRPAINPVSVPRPKSGSEPHPVSRPEPCEPGLKLRPRQAKYSLRLGEIERAEGERIAREMGITLADFIRLGFHNEIQRRKESTSTEPKRNEANDEPERDEPSALSVSTSEDEAPEL